MKERNELLTEEVVLGLDKMLRKLAMKKVANGHLKMEFEDVVSELWINTLNIIEKTGKVDFNYIAKASLNKMVSLVRYNIHREATPIPSEAFERYFPEGIHQDKDDMAGKSSTTYMYSTAKPESTDDRISFLEILGLFEKDSKEYMYVEAQMKLLGIIEVKDVTELPERAVDSWIASDVLGYAGCKSNGYLRLRNKVRQKLREAGYII